MGLLCLLPTRTEVISHVSAGPWGGGACDKRVNEDSYSFPLNVWISTSSLSGGPVLSAHESQVSGVVEVGFPGEDVTLLISAHGVGARCPARGLCNVHFANSMSLAPDNLEVKGPVSSGHGGPSGCIGCRCLSLAHLLTCSDALSPWRKLFLLECSARQHPVSLWSGD